MKSGTPGFIGKRLKAAREIRGLTATTLAEHLLISKQAISQYENGIKTPGPIILSKISKYLNFPKHFFLEPIKATGSNTIFFRSMSAATKQERIRAKHKLTWLKEIVMYLQKFIYFKKVNIPKYEIDSPLKLSSDDIESIALNCRKFWNIGDNPINNLLMLFENNGVIVARGKLEAEKLDALSEWDNEQHIPYVFLGNDKESAVRSKFDISHEVGHMIMHQSINDEKLLIPETFKIIENQAHRFAAVFLLPEETFLKDLHSPTLESFWMLKEKWKVSIALMIMRCRQLCIIDDDEYRRLWIKLGRRGWRKKEPLDNKIPMESPQFINRSIKLIVDKGGLSKEDILLSIPLPKSIIEELANLPPGYFDQEDIKGPLPILRTQSQKDENSETAKVIPFQLNN